MTPLVRPLVGRLVGWSVFLNFQARLLCEGRVELYRSSSLYHYNLKRIACRIFCLLASLCVFCNLYHNRSKVSSNKSQVIQTTNYRLKGKTIMFICGAYL